MNERILELARQADAYAWQQIDEGADYDKQPQFFAEKFAELIVRECSGVELYWLSEQDRKAVTDKIRQHFGVDQ